MSPIVTKRTRITTPRVISLAKYFDKTWDLWSGFKFFTKHLLFLVFLNTFLVFKKQLYVFDIYV